MMKKRITAISSVLCSLLLTGCVDKAYDIFNIDTTIGVNVKELTLPTSSIAKIKLADILKVEDEDDLSFDKDSNYVFNVTAEDIKPFTTKVNPIEFTQKDSKTISLAFDQMPLNAPAAANSKRKAANISPLTANGKIQTFSYDADLPADVISVSSAVTEAEIGLELTLPLNMYDVCRNIEYIKLTFPPFAHISDVVTAEEHSFDPATGVVTLSNIDPSEPVNIHVLFDDLKFGVEDASGNYLKVENGKLKMSGVVYASVKAPVTTTDITKVKELLAEKIESECDMETQFKITAATGRFSPDIKLDTIAKVDIDNLPSFLESREVNLDLYNPQINIAIDSELPLGGTIKGEMTAYKDGKATKTVDIPEFAVNPDDVTLICICRNAEATKVEDKVTKVEVPQLSELLVHIPDSIIFCGKATADSKKEATILLGEEYTVTPACDVSIPLSFGENAVIVYEEIFDNFHDDLEELELGTGASIEIHAIAENTTPLFLNVSLVPVDVYGKEIPGLLIDTKAVDVPASDGKTPTTAPITITVTNIGADPFEDLDGLKLTLIGASSKDGKSVTGVQLNGKTQYVSFKDVKITLDGQLIIE